MNSERPKLGIVSLGEAGNLGDDLILMAVVEAIYASRPDADVSFLSFGQALDWEEIARWRGLPSLPQRVIDKVELPFVRQNSRLFRDRDVIVFGGGGLMQTSHSPDRPYEWLSYLPIGRNSARVVAAGLGLGPINPKWMERLVALGSPFDMAWVRDPDSLRLARDGLAWDADECKDFIDLTFLEGLIGSEPPLPARSGLLGVAIREWPGLDVARVVRAIEDVAHQQGCVAVEFFVLEARGDAGMDVDFSRAVAEAISLPATVTIYAPSRIRSFVSKMTQVDAALSMKLHSSAIWASRSVPMYPIYYAPKVAAFFGEAYEGLQISERIVTPVGEESNAPRAAEAVSIGISQLLDLETTGHRFGLIAKTRFQLRRIRRAAMKRLTNMSKRTA